MSLVRGLVVSALALTGLARTSFAQEPSSDVSISPSFTGPAGNKDLIATPSPTPAAGPHDFATMPEGKTLPEKVIRARVIYGGATGTGYGYDKDGNKKDIPVDVKATGGAIVAEYGFSDRISLQFRQDYVTSYGVTTNKSSTAYQELKAGVFAGAANGAKNATELSQGIALKLSNNPDARAALCGGAPQADCLTSILNGTAKAAVKVPVTADLSIPQGATAKTILDGYAAAVDAQITAGIDAEAEQSGGIGIGDTTIGALYAVIDNGMTQVSLGGGIRYPTGNRDRSYNESKVGRGLTEIGTRLNVDVLPVEVLRVSWQNETQGMLAAGKYKWAGQDVTIKRNGLRNVGFLIVKPSLAGITPALGFLGPKLGMAYDFDSEEVTKVGSAEESSDSRSAEMKWFGGLAANLFDFGVPAQLEFEYFKSQSGKNVAAATDSWDVQLKAFYKF